MTEIFLRLIPEQAEHLMELLETAHSVFSNQHDAQLRLDIKRQLRTAGVKTSRHVHIMFDGAFVGEQSKCQFCHVWGIRYGKK